MTNKNAVAAAANPMDVRRPRIREILFLIRKLIHGNDLYTKELSKKYHVTSAQLNCLLTLYENGPLPPSQIARFMMVRSSTVTGVIDRLEQKNFLKRERNSLDRRIITICLTDAGKKMAQAAPPPIQQKVLDGLRRLPEEKLDQIIAALNTLASMLDIQDLDVE